MKLKQTVFPLVLIAMTAGSVYYMSGNRVQDDSKYETLLAKAREETEEKVYVDAAPDYTSLMSMRPSLELAIEAGEMYLAADDYNGAKSWYENRMQRVYYDDPRTYLFGLKMALEKEDYQTAFSYYETYCRRDFTSEEVEDLMHPYLYMYEEDDSFVDVRPFSDASGYAPVMPNDLWCYIKASGKQTTRSDYVKAGMMTARYGAVVTKDGTACYVDAEGNLKMPASYFEKRNPEIGKITEFKDVQSNLVLACNGKEWMYFDLDTRQLRFGGFKEATVITDGAGAVTMDGRKWAIISPEGTLLTDYIFDEVVVNEKGIACIGGVLFVRQGKEYRLVTTSGKTVNKSIYSDVCAFNEATLAAVKKDGQWIFADMDGNEYQLGEYEKAYSFSNGVAGVKVRGHWGYINKSGELVVEAKFDDVKQMGAAGSTFVKEEDMWTMLSFFRYRYEITRG